MKEVFQSSLMGNGLREICKKLNDREITNRGKRWHKSSLAHLLRNETYTGAAVCVQTVKYKKVNNPVWVEEATACLFTPSKP